MKINDIVPRKTLIEVGAAALDNPVTENLLALTSVTTKGDRDDASADFVSALRRLRSNTVANNEVRSLVAVADWQLRLTCDRKCQDGVTRPDYNGKTPLYKRLRDDALRAAGLDITSKTTPFEAQAIKAARDQHLTIVRYEVRKIADAVLSVEDLVASGFKWTAQLPSDQKLVKPTGTQRTVPVSERLSNVQAAFSDLLSRKAEIRREIPIADRVRLAKRISEQAASLVKVLSLTDTEKAAQAAQAGASAQVTGSVPSSN